MIFSITCTDSAVELASASWKVTKSRPPSSEGTNPDGLALNRKKAPRQIPSSSKRMTQEYFMLFLTPWVNPVVNFSKRRSNQRKNLSSRFFFFVRSVGFNKRVQR